jgi:hypothetical protein
MLVLGLPWSLTPAGVFKLLTERALETAAPTAPGALPGPSALATVAPGVLGLLGVAVLAAGSAVRALRRGSGRQGGGATISGPGPGLHGTAARHPLPDEARAARPGPSEPPASRPAIGDRPLLWKEMCGPGRVQLTAAFERLIRTKGWLLLLVPAVVLGAAPWGSLHWLARRATGAWWLELDSEESWKFAMRAATVLKATVMLLAFAWCALASFRATAAVSRERDARTLDGLLTLPVSRARVLAAKWLGAVLYGRGFGYLLLLTLAAGVAGGLLYLPVMPLLVLAVGAHLAFLTSVGIVLSVFSRTATQARVLTAVVLLVLFGGGLWNLPGPEPEYYWSQIPKYTPEPYRPRWLKRIEEVGANAPGTWWFLSVAQNDAWAVIGLPPGEWFVRDFEDRLRYATYGTGAYTLLAGGLFLVAVWRFRKE